MGLTRHAAPLLTKPCSISYIGRHLRLKSETRHRLQFSSSRSSPRLVVIRISRSLSTSTAAAFSIGPPVPETRTMSNEARLGLKKHNQHDKRRKEQTLLEIPLRLLLPSSGDFETVKETHGGRKGRMNRLTDAEKSIKSRQ